MSRKFQMVLAGVVIVMGLQTVGAFAQDRPELPPGFAEKVEQAERQKALKGEGGDQAEQEENVAQALGEQPKTFEELVEQWMTPMAVPKAGIVRIDDKYAYPHSAVSFKMEIVREEGDTIWLKGIPPEDPESAMHKMWIQEQEREAMLIAKMEFDEKIGTGKFVNFTEAVVPPGTIDAVVFENAGGNLPRSGLWQMSFDLADMNGDGELDIVLPPGRKGQPAHPLIFVADGKGDYNYWQEAKWNPEIPFDYGDVEVADFDQDGFLDIALAIHFKAQYILYGSEDHQFKRYDKLPAPDPRITSRGMAIADFDQDGRLDVAFQAEIDMDLSTNNRLGGSPTIWIVHNKPNGWRLAKDNPSEFVIGDRLSAEDMDGDGVVDLVASAATAAWRAILFLNRGGGSWSTLDESKVMGNGFHFDTQPYHRAGVEGAENKTFIYAVFEQFFRLPTGNEARTGLVRYSPAEGNDWSEINAEVLHFDDDRFSYYFRLAVGDLNGDGLEDLVTGRKKGGIEVWIQTQDGRFFQNKKDRLDVKGLAYDLEIVDLDGDGWGDIVASVADVEEEGPGGVFVLYSRPAA